MYNWGLQQDCWWVGLQDWLNVNVRGLFTSSHSCGHYFVHTLINILGSIVILGQMTVGKGKGSCDHSG